MVIDENGYAKIISGDDNNMLYPVCIERWEAGNNYVGKFSELPTLEEDYNSCLYSWLSYLRTGQGQYIDYPTEEIKEDILISQINKFYP